MRTKVEHLALLSLGALAGPVLAHDGQGLSAISHWHVTDGVGFIPVAPFVVAAAAAVIWLVRRK